MNTTTTETTENQKFTVRGLTLYVTIMKPINGVRNAVVSETPKQAGKPVRGYAVPVELLPLMCGKDRWMRDVKVRCAFLPCRAIFRAGDSDGRYCPKCVEAAEQENAEADGR